MCAHRFVDISEPSFGVAVLNDGRYGHSVQDGGVSVSLLRAAKYPDPDADHGRHAVTISLLPHGAGSARGAARGRSAEHAAACRAQAQASSRARRLSPSTIPACRSAAVKHADDGSGDLIVRLYEACGDRVVATVRTPSPIGGAFRCNLLEEPHSGIECSDGIVSLTLRPFELVTLRLAARRVAIR